AWGATTSSDAAYRSGPGWRSSKRLPLGQLQLDAAVAGVGGVGGALLERLVFAEAGGDGVGRLHALVDEEAHHRDGARRRQLPVVAEAARARERARVGMTVDAEHPGDLRRNLAFEHLERLGELRHLDATLGVDLVRAGREQHFRLEDEA